MKNFLRVTAIVFLLVVIIIILRSGILKGGSSTNDSEQVTGEFTTEVTSDEVFAEVSETEEEIQDIINPAPEEDEGIVILGGDGIPNN